MQAFEAIATALSQHIAEQIQQTGHRSIALVIEDAHFAPAHPSHGATPLRNEIHLARSTVQALMAERYGFTAQASDISPEDSPVSATEQRITLALKDAIEQALALTLSPSDARQEISSTVTPSLWQWDASIRIAALPATPISIRLNLEYSHRLETCVARQRKPSRRSTGDSPPMQIDLQAVLLEKTVTAADIYQLQVGSVMPIALERARVNLNGHAMLSASVAEHQGKLHLTAFENLE